MRTIHVLRKPCSEGTVAANVLRHGTGAINVDGCRVSTSDVVQTHSRSPEASAKVNRPVYGEYGSLETHQTPGQALGRWPANVILQHLDGCRCMGMKRIRPPGADNETKHKVNPGGEGLLEFSPSKKDHISRRGADGWETVPSWICAEGCPGGYLDSQVAAGAKNTVSTDTSRFFQHVRLKPEGG